MTQKVRCVFILTVATVKVVDPFVHADVSFHSFKYLLNLSLG